MRNHNSRKPAATVLLSATALAALQDIAAARLSAANDHQVRLHLTAPEARQMDDARARLRLSRDDLVRLALDDLYRGRRLAKAA